MSTIFPAVRAVGAGLGENIFYLTAKTITRTVAEEAFSILKEHGLKFKVITITAKEKLCFCDKTECNPENCLWARGHLDRVNDAVLNCGPRRTAMTGILCWNMRRNGRCVPLKCAWIWQSGWTL